MGVPVQKKITADGEAINAEFCAPVAAAGEAAAPTAGATFVLEKTHVEHQVELHDKYSALFKDFLGDHAVFHQCRKASFEAFVTSMLTKDEKRPTGQVEKKEITAAEVLSVYCDALMKRELKDLSGEAQELERVDKVVVLFSYLKDKDIFHEFYKAKLARRILQTTPNEDLERAMLEKLQRLMGKNFTHHMEGMLADREAARAMQQKFQDQYKDKVAFDFACQVLTTGHWPSYKADSLSPPKALADAMQLFTLFYKKSTQSRKLQWIHALGTSTLAVKFPRGTKEVTCTTHQATLLVLLDENGVMPLGELSKSMNLDPKSLMGNLVACFASKAYNVVVKCDEGGKALEQQSAKVAESDRFCLNTAFTYKTRKFKLPTAHAQNLGAPTNAEIDEKRKFVIDATVVRIMKSRHTLQYNELIEQAMQQLSRLFTPQPRFIKQRIEELITRQYLKRDEDDPSKFHYLA